jgi:hypothetical protein
MAADPTFELPSPSANPEAGGCWVERFVRPHHLYTSFRCPTLMTSISSLPENTSYRTR